MDPVLLARRSDQRPSCRLRRPGRSSRQLGERKGSSPGFSARETPPSIAASAQTIWISSGRTGETNPSMRCRNPVVGFWPRGLVLPGSFDEKDAGDGLLDRRPAAGLAEPSGYEFLHLGMPLERRIASSSPAKLRESRINNCRFHQGTGCDEGDSYASRSLSVITPHPTPPTAETSPRQNPDYCSPLGRRRATDP